MFKNKIKLTRDLGLQLQYFGCVLIVTVMLTDRYLFGVQNKFILTCAIISAIFLTAGIRIVKKFDQ